MLRQRARSRPSARRAASLRQPHVSPARARASARARAGTQGRHDVQRQADMALRTFLAGSRVSFRFAPLARDTRVRTRRKTSRRPETVVPAHFFFRARAFVFGGGLYTMPSSFMPSGSVK